MRGACSRRHIAKVILKQINAIFGKGLGVYTLVTEAARASRIG